MIPLTLPAVEKILCLGAHCDDIEIGCGASVMRLIEAYPRAHVHWVVFSSNEQRAAEARAAAGRFLAGVGSCEVLVAGFRDGFLPWHGREVKEVFEELKRQISPDLIFTHYGKDAHQDHRLVSELTWNTWRSHMVWEYEIPKYDGDLGRPNFFVHVSEGGVRRKIDYLLESFPSQRDKAWFTADTFRGLMRLRGVEASATSGFAEAFFVRKACI